ncbi:MAG: hypothetical protein A2Y36_05360 [Treponema sp. GWA1_62_8]|nr:MAG: hypothetical protein A2Y36_05360 [Treponema sp. GWA1_62_8]
MSKRPTASAESGKECPVNYAFTFARTPRLEFGPRRLALVPALIAGREKARGFPFAVAALVTGGASFRAGSRYAGLVAELRSAGVRLLEFACAHEPDPDFIDASAAALLNASGGRAERIAVLAVGGGSAMDAGKAIAALCAESEAAAKRGETPPSVKNFLEGVGDRTPSGSTSWLLAAPTTAGTGSEATKNAVISKIGAGGFKKSLRHDSFVPAVAVVDAELALGCPHEVTAASGLDALVQLLEAWTSPQASPLVEAVCASGIVAFARSFERVLADGNDLEARSDMAYAAYCSGLGLANAGLGCVHALASPLGSRYPVPHGAACAALLVPATDLNLRLLRERGGEPGSRKAIAAYAAAARLLAPLSGASGRPEDGLPAALRRLVTIAGLRRLADWGMREADIPELASAAGTKTNPVALAASDYEALLHEAI